MPWICAPDSLDFQLQGCFLQVLCNNFVLVSICFWLVSGEEKLTWSLYLKLLTEKQKPIPFSWTLARCASKVKRISLVTLGEKTSNVSPCFASRPWSHETWFRAIYDIKEGRDKEHAAFRGSIQADVKTHHPHKRNPRADTTHKAMCSLAAEFKEVRVQGQVPLGSLAKDKTFSAVQTHEALSLILLGGKGKFHSPRFVEQSQKGAQGKARPTCDRMASPWEKWIKGNKNI